MARAQHVVLDLKTGEWVCQHCEEVRKPPAEWVPMKVWLAKMRGFILLHRYCKPRSESPP